ncbi:hypothetical protein [Paremcibacter congregatus]|uniref:hypothetical protein n=1 Tax=Paremcibacter congregatus TaxID=2043170 RepID=UPI0030EE2FEA|tara:strand:- start:2726 stop:4024 length:1299 start_codon:yes stop_codon:yes gene_type:complete
MKFSYTHLPEQVQNDLTHIAAFLVRQTIPAQDPHDRYTPSRIRHIILQGCFTEDHWTPDTILHPDVISYSYNLMVIVSAHLCDILPSLERAVEQLNQSGKVSFPVLLRFADTKGRIDRKLRNGYLAYDQIQVRGTVIYSKGDITEDLFQPPERPAAAEHLVRAQGYYDHAYPLAHLFFAGAKSFAEKDRGAAAFMLNLSAAQGYEALMVVHILKYPLGRPLSDLRELAESLHPELAVIWTGLKAVRTFDLLTRAFGHVRFSPDYTITTVELNMMFGHVEDLHKLVSRICHLKFDALKTGSLAKPQKDGLEIVREALEPPEDWWLEDDETEAEPPVLQITDPFPAPLRATAEQGSSIDALSTALSAIEEPCSELHTMADILRSLSENNAGTASSCEVYLMAQIIEERIRVIERLYGHMFDLIEGRQDNVAIGS